ncbi:hypothetical protein [Salinicola halophilus]|uniref:hypothetical protein n=1 Tax=Salinicola halophilus TaxID=184065 RepID=UPI000DA22E57|nr:hypothetical protein [Salinicola halophilus]
MRHLISRRQRWALGTLVSLWLATSPAWATCQPNAVDYDLPTQRLDQALQQFAHRSGCFVEVTQAALAGQQASPTKGRFVPTTAIIHLVQGTGLEVHLDGDHYRVDHSDREAMFARIDALTDEIASARAQGALDAARANALSAQLDVVTTQMPALIAQQGFLSAAEKASYTRLFAWVETQLTPESPPDA